MGLTNIAISVLEIKEHLVVQFFKDLIPCYDTDFHDDEAAVNWQMPCRGTA